MNNISPCVCHALAIVCAFTTFFYLSFVPRFGISNELSLLDLEVLSGKLFRDTFFRFLTSIKWNEPVKTVKIQDLHTSCLRYILA